MAVKHSKQQCIWNIADNDAAADMRVFHVPPPTLPNIHNSAG
jgi:hypothetical protein